MIRFALIGAGWRAEFYVRIAKLMPEAFFLTSVLVRNPQKGREFAKRHSVRVVNDLDSLLKDSPEFVVVSVRKGCGPEVILPLCEQGIPVLTETPPAYSLGSLAALWREVSRLHGDVQVAEQYLYQPLYSAWDEALRQNMIGEVTNLSLSSVHGYHAAAIIRHCLKTGFEDCCLWGKRYTFPVTKTGGRAGMCFDGEVVQANRDRMTFEFQNGKTAFFDFDGTQYHSSIRTRQLNIQGTRGEIDDLTIRCLDQENRPIRQTLRRIDQGVWNNQEWSHFGITLGAELLYRSPFPTARLNDDELAVATCLLKMHEHLNHGGECYPLAEALQDTYLSLKMEEAL